jgi:hypothetical protein
MATKKESAQQDSTSSKGSAKANTGDGETDSNISQDLEQLMQSLQGDLGEIDADQGLALIKHWHDFLNKSKESSVKKLASGLKDLEKILKGGKATGQDISEALIHIGEETVEFASDADKEVKQAVQKLGKQLRKAGTSIAQSGEKNYHDQLDELIDKAEGEELTALDTEAAIGSIDFWYNTLHKSEDAKLKEVATSLRSLKQALGKGNTKPETLAKAMVQVGEKTGEVASAAPRGFKGAIQKLGKRLVAAGETLTEK